MGAAECHIVRPFRADRFLAADEDVNVPRRYRPETGGLEPGSS